MPQQQMLGRRSPPPNWPVQQPQGWPGQQPQGWPGQQPGFNLQEATGALATAQGLLGDASSEITAADMEPLSNARGMVSQAQHVLSRGFGLPKVRVPRPYQNAIQWGGPGGISGAQQVAGVGPLANLLSPHPTTPQDLGPQGIAPPLLPAFMANGGPAETTGIGPLYMKKGGLTFGAGDAIGLAASVADNLGAFAPIGLSGITGPVGIGLGIFNALRTGNPLDAIPFNLGNVIKDKFFGGDEEEEKNGPPDQERGPWGPLGDVPPGMWQNPHAQQPLYPAHNPRQNPFDTKLDGSLFGSEEVAGTDPGGFGSMEGYGGGQFDPGYAEGGLASLL